MAYAMIAGLPPVYGLYAAVVPQIIYAIFGTSRQLSVAPVAMDSLLVAAGVGLMAEQGSEAYITLAILVAFFMGTFQLLLGIFKMGFITNLLSRPVISGFTSAAAIIIALSQLPNLLGVKMERSTRAYEMIGSLAEVITNAHVLSLIIGVVGIVLIVLIKSWSTKIPASLIAVIISTALVSIFGWNELGVNIVKEVPSGFPTFSLPNITWQNIQQVAPLAMTIAIIAFMEAFSVAKAIEAKKRDHEVRPSQELIALGAANFIGSMFSSYPVTGGFSRTAVNVESGANTPLSSLISAGIVALTLIFLTPLFYFLPKAILASIIMVAVAGLIDIKFVRTIWKENKVEFALLMITFLVTLNVGMVEGILTGISVAVLHLIYKMAYPHIAQLGRVKDHHEYRNIRRFKNLQTWDWLLLLRLDASLTFINIQYFKDYVIRNIDDETKYVILDAGPVSHLDTSAIEGLRDLIQTLNEKEIVFILCDMIGPVRDIVHRTGFMDTVKEDNIFIDLHEAVKYVTTKQKGDFNEYATQHEE